MNPSTLYMLRKSLCLSQDGLGQFLVRRKSVISDWEKGVYPIPDEVAQRVQALAESVRIAACQNSEAYSSTELPDDDDRVAVLLTYKQDDYHRWKLPDADVWPLTDLHTACCIKVADLLAMQGRQVRFVVFDWDAYQQWLGGGADTSAHRAAWATFQN
jgi:hypothetical protein